MKFILSLTYTSLHKLLKKSTFYKLLQDWCGSIDALYLLGDFLTTGWVMMMTMNLFGKCVTICNGLVW